MAALDHEPVRVVTADELELQAALFGHFLVVLEPPPVRVVVHAALDLLLAVFGHVHGHEGVQMFEPLRTETKISTLRANSFKFFIQVFFSLSRGLNIYEFVSLNTSPST